MELFLICEQPVM